MDNFVNEDTEKMTAQINRLLEIAKVISIALTFLLVALFPYTFMIWFATGMLVVSAGFSESAYHLLFIYYILGAFFQKLWNNRVQSLLKSQKYTAAKILSILILLLNLSGLLVWFGWAILFMLPT